MQFTTDRLVIRPFEEHDTPAIQRIMDLCFGDGSKVDDPEELQERASWVRWSGLSQVWFPRLHQPPYGELAITLKPGGEVIGGVGLVPCLTVFGQIPSLRVTPADQPIPATPEVGLFWAIDPDHRRQGYAAEAAAAVIQFAFTELGIGRIVATTEYDNEGSQAVMRKLGMRIERNPLPTPPWLQVVGVLEAGQHPTI